MSSSPHKDPFSRQKEILSKNSGFENVIDTWAPLVDSLKITCTPSERRDACPYCNNEKHFIIGQFLYYSNLIRLRECRSCKLIFTDVIINQTSQEAHFEIAYKDESYFLYERGDIFKEITLLVDSYTPKDGTILDIGGATGVLADDIRKRRPDLSISVSDISTNACDLALSKGFIVLNTSISELPEGKKYDTILMIDVMYYERDLPEAIKKISDSLSDNGLIVFRGPNKRWLISFLGNLRKMNSLSTRIPFFNPEHLYILSPSFIKKCFEHAGAYEVRIVPSAPLKKKGFLNRIRYFFTNTIVYLTYYVSGKVVSPSYLAVIKKRKSK
jgi:2-polyprenyl-3-methyl-5-hydroxy-6-metoxy-1,4-benzoquinol methylase